MTKYTNTIVTLLLLLIFSGTSLMAQNRQNQTDDKKKMKKGLFLTDHSPKIKLPSGLSLKGITDNDIGRTTDESFEESEWFAFFQENYSYSEDRRTINVEYYFYDEGQWQNSGSLMVRFSEEGYPLEFSESYGEDSYSETYFYAEAGKLDSVQYVDIYEGENYSGKIGFNYITEDSIRVSDTYENAGQTVVDEYAYFLDKDDNFVQVFESDEYDDRYTYYGSSWREFLKNLFNDFYFVESYNDELYPDQPDWVPYGRVNLTEEDNIVTAVIFDYYYDETGWETEYRDRMVYTDGKVTEMYYGYSGDNGASWEEFDRTRYEYGEVVSNESAPEVAEKFRLSQNFPNPFNPTTNIMYNLPSAGQVTLEVFNVLGNRVATLVNRTQNAGEYTITFNAGNLPTGVYYYKLQTSGFSEVRSMMLIK